MLRFQVGALRIPVPPHIESDGGDAIDAYLAAFPRDVFAAGQEAIDAHVRAEVDAYETARLEALERKRREAEAAATKEATPTSTALALEQLLAGAAAAAPYPTLTAVLPTTPPAFPPSHADPFRIDALSAEGEPQIRPEE